MIELLKRPGGFVPLSISACFLGALGWGMARGALVRQPDEDVGAHLFQILMPLQAVIIVLFAFTWLPRKPKPALAIFVLQAVAALAVILIVHAYQL
jgi:hypothetical protein